MLSMCLNDGKAEKGHASTTKAHHEGSYNHCCYYGYEELWYI